RFDLALLAQDADHALDLAALGAEEARHAGGEPRIAHVVHAPRRLRVEAAQPLEVAARARLEALDAGGDAVLDRRIVADVEVQEAELLVRPPIAAVQRPALLHVECPGDQLSPPARGEEAEVAAKALAQELEEALRQVAPPVDVLVDRGEVEV